MFGRALSGSGCTNLLMMDPFSWENLEILDNSKLESSIS